MASTKKTTTGNPLLDNPGWSATVVTVILIAGFLFAVYSSATSGHGGGGDGHGGGHGGAPSHPVAPAAASGSAPAAHH